MEEKLEDRLEKTITVFDIPIAAVTMEMALNCLQQRIEDGVQTQVGVVNAAKVVNMKRNPELGEDVLSSDIIYADGMSVVWASRWLGNPLPERVAGIDLMMGLLERANQKGYRVFCLGATEEVSAEVERRIRAEFPGVQFAGRRNGYFDQSEEQEVAQLIKEARADILFVAMTSPKKENFLAKWSKHMDVTICHGVGGSFDVYAGKVKRAPESWQRLGLEWFYRFKQEPIRLFRRYFVTNTLFLLIVLQEMMMRWARMIRLDRSQQL